MKKILVTTMIAAGVVTASHAFSPAKSVYITGATAFRGQVYTILNNNITAPTDGTAKGIPGQSGSQNIFTFQGKWKADSSAYSGLDVAVYCSFSGSVEGQRDMLQGNSVTYSNVSGGTFSHAPELSFSDVKQETAKYASVKPALNGQQVAVLPFAWAANPTAIAAGVSNINNQQIGNILGAGQAYLSMFTGSLADYNNGTAVSVVGRNAYSGTRVTMLAESGYGVFTPVLQYYWDPTCPCWVPFPTPPPPPPIVDVDLYGGYASGSGVTGDLSYTNAAGVAIADPAVGYCGMSDAGNLKNGAKIIAYNGVPYSTNNVQFGGYTFWTYENLFVKSTASSDTTSMQTALVNEIQAYFKANPSPSTILIENMNVHRNADGGQIFNN